MALEINKDKLTFSGSMNYVLQVGQSGEDKKVYYIDNYMPRRNRVASQEEQYTREEVVDLVQETIERMKIAINLFQDFVDGKTEGVYYWQEEDGK